MSEGTPARRTYSSGAPHEERAQHAADDAADEAPSVSRDSAGLPWAGRELTGTGREDDTGAADPGLLAATGRPEDETDLVRAVAAARLLVPIVAVPTEVDDPGPHPVEKSTDVAVPTEVDDPGPHPVEKSTDMAVVTLTAPDGQRALPVFSSSQTLAAWDARARPVPVTAAQAAQAAVSEQCEVMVVDLGAPHQVVLRPSMLWALAQHRDWLPAHEDPFVAQALARATRDEPAVAGCAGEAGEPDGTGVLRVVLTLRPGLDADAVQQLATRIGERIATDGETRARIDAMAFAIRQA